MDDDFSKPSWVISWTLKASEFTCCGNQEPFPFQCDACLRPYVWCLECDTLFSKLPATTVQEYFDCGHWGCRYCQHEFPRNLFTSARNRVSFANWNEHGLESLLVVPPIDELLTRFVKCTQPAATYLQRGARSLACTWSFALCPIAGALESSVEGAAAVRQIGFDMAIAAPLTEAISYWESLHDPRLRAFAIMGVTEALDSKRKSDS